MKVMAISGSLRRGSFNTMALGEAMRQAPAGMTVERADISQLPFYNGDIDTDELRPEPVRRFIALAQAADAFLIATPEYNYSIPAPLKNAVDWLSRGRPQPFAGKGVAILGASPGALGSARAQYHLRQCFVFLDATVLNKPEIMIGKAHEKFDAEGKLTDDGARQLMKLQLEALAALTKRLKG